MPSTDTLVTIQPQTTNVTVTPEGEAKVTLAQGVEGAQGPAGPTTLFFGPTQPVVVPGTPYLWVQTGLGDGTGFTLNYHDGEE